jgi:UDP-2,3-diacylglucosamine pyrophosphatase LpxH
VADTPNILVVSDLHFGEELLPGASTDRREAVELGAKAFCEFLRYQRVRKIGGRSWRLVIAGDLFDFMSVVIPGSPELPAKSADERRLGVGRGAKAGVARLAAICAGQRQLLEELARFATAGHRVDIIVGNHDVELLEPEVADELYRQLAAAGADAAALGRIRVVPWFVYVPGVAWIEHGHVYDEGCSFEFNLAPCDPKEDRLIYNADYAAIRYLAMASPELDPHGIEEWSFAGYLKYAWSSGVRHMGRLWLAYLRFAVSLFAARGLHRSVKRRDRRRALHRERLAAAAAAGGVKVDTALAIDRLARSPVTTSWRRVARMLHMDRLGLLVVTSLVIAALLLALPLGWAVLGGGAAALGALGIARAIGAHYVASQLPMRAVPARIRRLVDAPVVVFGHTHDPRWQELPNEGLYVNSGTWLAAMRPGLRRSFTHVLVEPVAGGRPRVELRQWRDGVPAPFDARADLGAGVTSGGAPGPAIDALALSDRRVSDRG